MLFYNIRSRSLLVQYKVKVKIWFRNIYMYQNMKNGWNINQDGMIIGQSLAYINIHTLSKIKSTHVPTFYTEFYAVVMVGIS